MITEGDLLEESGLMDECFSFHRRTVYCDDSCSGQSNVWTDLNPSGSLEESPAREHAQYKLPRRGRTCVSCEVLLV